LEREAEATGRFTQSWPIIYVHRSAELPKGKAWWSDEWQVNDPACENYDAARLSKEFDHLFRWL
jgi:hypothetical protein